MAKGSHHMPHHLDLLRTTVLYDTVVIYTNLLQMAQPGWSKVSATPDQ
jgi:hypothetical protein